MFAARLASCVAGLALSLAAYAHDYKLGPLSIDHPFARVTVSGQNTGAGYMKIANAGPADRLVSASTPACERVEMHSMQMDGDIMRMRQLQAIELPAGKTVELKPGGLHLMLVGLKTPLKAGEKFPLRLKFEKAGELSVEVHVEAPSTSAAGHGHDSHNHGNQSHGNHKH